MLKKILLSLGALLVLTVLLSYVYRNELMMAVIGSQIAPDHPFDASRLPPAPDYADKLAWAALPEIDEASDDRPAGVTGEPAAVAVFFAHPTSYIDKQGWNQPLDDDRANWVVDERILRHQASVFNSCCAVYAPRYRQATFFSFLDTSGSGEQALDAAYADLARAFDTFIDGLSEGRPFILAGHSQGTMHAARLLREKIADTPNLERMVAAYLVGFNITNDALGGVPRCTTPTQTRCAIGWNAVDGDSAGIYAGVDNLMCINPLTWGEDEQYAKHELNAGAIGYPGFGLADDGEDFRQMNVEVGAADAQCIDGQLTVPALRSTAFPSRMPGNSMHVYDYSLFHMNVRQNAVDRVEAYLAGS